MTYSNRSEELAFVYQKIQVSEVGPKKHPCHAENFLMVVMGSKAEICLSKEVYLKTKSQAHSVRKLLNIYTRQKQQPFYIMHNKQQFLIYTF